jgi:hypothetical protein
MTWVFYFAAAWGLAYIMGAARISYSLRVLLAGDPGQDAIAAQYALDAAGNKFLIRPALPQRDPIPPLIPVVGPFLVDLLECMACSGFWIGLVSSFWLPRQLGSNDVAWAFVVACATSGVNYLLGTFTHERRVHNHG